MNGPSAARMGTGHGHARRLCRRGGRCSSSARIGIPLRRLGGRYLATERRWGSGV